MHERRLAAVNFNFNALHICLVYCTCTSIYVQRITSHMRDYIAFLVVVQARGYHFAHAGGRAGAGRLVPRAVRAPLQRGLACGARAAARGRALVPPSLTDSPTEALRLVPVRLLTLTDETWLAVTWWRLTWMCTSIALSTASSALRLRAMPFWFMRFSTSLLATHTS